MTNRRETETDLPNDDADPLIDALLAEFVPRQSNQRVPPDLTAQILAQLAAVPSSAASFESSDVRTENGSGPVPVIKSVEKRAGITGKGNQPAKSSSAGSLPPRKPQAALPRLISIFVAIAAGVLAMVWISNEYGDGPTSNPRSSKVAQSDSTEPSMPLADSGSGDQVLASSDDPSRVKPKVIAKPIPLAFPESVAQSDEDAIEGMKTNRSSPADHSVVPVELVAKATSTTARKYWSALGMEPTPDAPADLVAKRLSKRLGVTIPAETIGDAKALGQFLSAPSRSREIAKRWLSTVSNRSLGEIASPERQELVRELGRAVAGKVRFDTKLVSLIDGSDQQSSVWFETLGRGNHQRTADQLASVTMNADMRCVRCHDSMIGRSGTQDDYWSFVALVQSVLAPAKGPVFYELSDGRQRLATPKVNASLADTKAGFESFDQWTESLVDSPQLAASMVDSLWSLVHGRKLKPSPVDAFAPPADSALSELHVQLAEDLRYSGFNVARTLALIMTSPMANRSVPPALQADALLTTTDGQRRDALEKVAAYGAAISAPSSSRSQRLDLVMRRLGKRLDGVDQGTVLAQPISGTPSSGKKAASTAKSRVISFQQRLGVDLPDDDSPLPVSWLRSINDFDEQSRHLAYLSGYRSLPEDVQEVAELLKESNNPSASLGRLWWILRN